MRCIVQRRDGYAAVFDVDLAGDDGSFTDAELRAIAAECIEAQGGVYDLRGVFLACAPRDVVSCEREG